MKKFKFAISMAVIFIMTSTVGMKASCLEYCGTIRYLISDNQAVITGYIGRPEILSLPSQIDGKPVTEIRENAFYKCGTLREITVPESVLSIGHHAFYECTSLNKIEIKGSLNQLPEGVFYGCENLEYAYLKTAPSTISDYAFYGCRSLSGLDMPAGVTDIGKYCFGECCSLNKITLGSNLKNIKEYAFYGCTNLKKLNLPDTLLTIGQQAVGFSENGKSDNITIMGMSGSIAENYAKTNEIKFISRIRYKNPDEISGTALSQFLTWLSFAVVYALVMTALLTGAKRKRNTTV